MKTFITALVIMAALAFGGAYAATSRLFTGSIEEIRGIKYTLTGDVTIDALYIDLDIDTETWHLYMDVTFTEVGTFNFATTDEQLPLTVIFTASDPSIVVSTPETQNKVSLGTLSDYLVGDYTFMVDVTQA